jgi:hypothetical protein
MQKMVVTVIAASAVIVIAAAVLIVWGRTPPLVPTTPTQTIVDQFTPFASFRASDAPGTVWRVAPDGTVRKVIALPVKVHEAAEVTYGIRASRRFSADQLLRVIADNANCVPASASFKPEAKGLVDVKSVSGQREFVYDAELESHLRDLRQMFRDKKIAFNSTDRYWMIRETIKTPNVEYTSSTDWLAAASAEATLKACANSAAATEAKVSFNWNSSQQVTLNKTFPEPLRGWYLADPLVLDQPFGAGPGEPPDIRLARPDEKAGTSPPEL